MGFNLTIMFEELFDILRSDEKDEYKVVELREAIQAAYEYAKECGQLR